MASKNFLDETGLAYFLTKLASWIPSWFPSQTGQSGKVLTTDGFSLSWTAQAGGDVRLVEAWKSSDGGLWYRKWSDGWIEQGGPMSTNNNVTFHVAFSNTNYYVDVTWNGGKSHTFFASDWVLIKSSNTYFETSATTNGPNVRGLCWYACGY